MMLAELRHRGPMSPAATIERQIVGQPELPGMVVLMLGQLWCGCTLRRVTLPASPTRSCWAVLAARDA
jgi:hypothetical protein